MVDDLQTNRRIFEKFLFLVRWFTLIHSFIHSFRDLG